MALLHEQDHHHDGNIGRSPVPTHWSSLMSMRKIAKIAKTGRIRSDKNMPFMPYLWKRMRFFGGLGNRTRNGAFDKGVAGSN